MSSLLNPNFSRECRLQQDIDLNEIPLGKYLSDTISVVFTRIFNVAGVPWRYAIRKIDQGENLPNLLDIELHCHCDSRTFFMLEVTGKVTIVHQENEELSISHEITFPVDWKEKIGYFPRIAEIPQLLNPDNRFLIGGEDQNQKIRLEFETTVTEATSQSLPIPRFTDEVEYNDICIQTPRKDFFVSSMILQERLKHHKRILGRKTGNMIDLRRHVRTWEFFEFLKLVYLYQDDISIVNVESSLKLARRFGAEGVTFMIEKYLLRTQQLHVIDKLVIADQFGLDHVMNMAIRSINIREQFAAYTARSARFRGLPLAIKHEIEDQLHDPDYRMDDVADIRILIVGDNMPLAGQNPVESGKSEFHGIEMHATIEYLAGDYKIKVYCQGPVREEFFLARMKLMAHFEHPRAVPTNIDALFTPHHQVTSLTVGQNGLDPRQPFSLVVRVILTELHVSSNFSRSRNVDFHDAKRLSNASVKYDGVVYHVIKEVLASSSKVFATLFKGTYRKRKSCFKLEVVGCDNFEEGLQHLWHGARTFSPRGYYDIVSFVEKIGSARLSQELDIWSCRRWPEISAENYEYARENAFMSMLFVQAYKLYGMAGVNRIADTPLGPRNGQPQVIQREANPPVRQAIAAERQTPPLDPEEEAEEAPEAPAPEVPAPEPRNIFAENIRPIFDAPEVNNLLAELQMPFPGAEEAQRQAEDNVALAVQEIRNIRDPPPVQGFNNPLEMALGMVGGGGQLEAIIREGLRRALPHVPAPQGLLAPNNLLQMQEMLDGLFPPQFPAQGPFPVVPGPFPAGPDPIAGFQLDRQPPGPNQGPDGPFQPPQDPENM